ncbi:hypothetical protein HYV83_05495 [Candidatus Woesearchaeota archaeon]|nr:hypothetical protein [Candidatus Woesearchaeota archaeon]
MKINKKGVFRTLEALIAIFITFLFLLVFIPQQRELSVPETPPNILAGLRDNEDFRNCIILKNQTCINQTLDKNLEDKYDFKFNLSEDPHVSISGLPQKRVYANSIFIGGNTTNSTSLIVRLYFWTKPA